MQLIRLNDFETILRQGNEKLILFCGDDPWVAILGRVCFLRHYYTTKNVCQEYVSAMMRFSEDYKWAYDHTIVSHETVEQLSITI